MRKSESKFSIEETLQKQRAMRANRKTALQRRIIAVLDIGSTKIACMIVEFDDKPKHEDDRVISFKGQLNFKIVGAHVTESRGVKFGEVETVADTNHAISTVFTRAQQIAKRNVDHVVVCFSGARPKSELASGRIGLIDKPVDETDVARVLASCEIPEFASNRELLHAQPVNFGVDHRVSLNDPRNLLGNSLDVDMHLLSVDKMAFDNIIGCVDRCNVNLAGITTSAYMSGLACLVEDEQEIGGACVDIGGGTTSISIFFKKHMIFAETVPIGGRTITTDISQIFGVSFREAEKIKTVNGGVVATQRDDWNICAFGSGKSTEGLDHEIYKATRTELIGVMRPRAEEILEIIRSKLREAGFDQLPGNRIVLTGGCSVIRGLDELAKRILGKHIRFGLPIRVRGLPQLMTDPQFSASVGLCLYAAQPDDELWDFRTPSEIAEGSSLKRAFRWFRHKW